ncbi:MAG: hypothetical protein ASARMPREDX12_004161 [Alectoria sarmentosa]|nr:MAG: hypothetical protein ASARMPREDX12_004161 [Alectoria sarmentosa]
MSFKSHYKKYGNNEPYTESEATANSLNPRGPKEFLRLLTGPSTNIYVGPEEVHYTIPKQLLYRFSDFAKPCLEGDFFEAGANAIWLPDVDPDVFQWVWQWLYTGRMDVDDLHYFQSEEKNQKACELLCQTYMLGERLLLDRDFLRDVKKQLKELTETAKKGEIRMPWTADIIHQVLSGSAPAQFGDGYINWKNPSLRPFLLGKLRTIDFCTNFDFSNCGESFKLDGEFTAELMEYLAAEMKWAVELWEAQTDSSVDIAEKKLELAQAEGTSESITKRSKGYQGIWLALSQCFELDGSFAAELLNFMAIELRWIIERWGQERGPKVDVMQEKEDRERIEEEYEDAQYRWYKYQYRRR